MQTVRRLRYAVTKGNEKNSTLAYTVADETQIRYFLINWYSGAINQITFMVHKKSLFEKINLNNIDKNNFLVKNLGVSKEAYSKSRNQLLPAKTCCTGRTLGSPVIYQHIFFFNTSS